MFDTIITPYKNNGLQVSFFTSAVALSVDINHNPVLLQQLIQKFSPVCQGFDTLKSWTQIGHKNFKGVIPFWSGPFLFRGWPTVGTRNP